MKRFIPIIVFFSAVLFTACSVGDAEALSPRCTDSHGVRYDIDLDAMTASVIGFRGDYAGDLCIPSYVRYFGVRYPVICIREKAFFQRNDITSVTISEGIVQIQDYAFMLCENMQEVHLPSTLERVEDGAFYGCGSLKRVVRPKSESSYIGLFAYDGCDALEEPLYTSHIFVQLPDNYEGEYTVPDGIEVIAGGAFRNCTKLTAVHLPASLKEIKRSAFNNCTSLTEIDIPDSVTWIGNFAFKRCLSLRKVHMSSSVQQIHAYAFLICKDLEEIQLPNGLKEIGNSAFLGCIKLKEVVIPSSVEKIGVWAFFGCPDLKKVHMRHADPSTIVIEDSRRSAFAVHPFIELVEGVTVYVPQGCSDAYRQHWWFPELTIKEEKRKK